MSKLISSALAALLLSTPEARPQDKHPAPAPVTFQTFDHDGDGKVTREEFSDAFTRLDRNHDGVLTRDELAGPASHGPKDKKGKSKPGKGNRKR